MAQAPLGEAERQFAAALDAYDAEVDTLLAHGQDLELYRKVNARMDELRLCANAFPEVVVTWVEVLIRHYELSHGLWRVQQGVGDPSVLGGIHEQHRAAIGALRLRIRHRVAPH